MARTTEILCTSTPARTRCGWQESPALAVQCRDHRPPSGPQRDWLAFCDKVHQANDLPSLRTLASKMYLSAGRIGELLRGEALPTHDERARPAQRPEDHTSTGAWQRSKQVADLVRSASVLDEPCAAHRTPSSGWPERIKQLT